MNIGIITYSLKTGGVETYIETLATFFSSQGNVVDIIETISKGEQSDFFRSREFNVKTILIHPFESKYQFAHRLSKYLKKYDVLILNQVPFIHFLLGLLPKHTVTLPILHNNIDEFFNTVVLNKGQWNKIICVSPALEETLKVKKGLNNNEVVTIINGIKVENSWPRKSENHSNNNALKLLYVGRIENKQKGVLLLPKIIKKVAQNIDKKFSLEIIGDGPSFSLLKKEIAKLGLEKFIFLLGRKKHKDVLLKIRNSDILIMPSYYEGQGFVYIEAMGQGTVPIVSNLKNNTDLIVSNGKNGFLCEIGDCDCFSNYILMLQQDRERLRKMSYQAWKTASEHLSVELMTKKYMNVINEARLNNVINRSNKIENITNGHLPYFLVIVVEFFFKVTRKFFILLGKH